jgi:hypothetical protein
MKAFLAGMRAVARATALAIALAATATGIAVAQDRRTPPPSPSDACWFLIFCSQPSTPGANWQLYRESGTLGRQGLGASPYHPEGPGNRSF